jgi:hypothetical protein
VFPVALAIPVAAEAVVVLRFPLFLLYRRYVCLSGT